MTLSFTLTRSSDRLSDDRVSVKLRGTEEVMSYWLVQSWDIRILRSAKRIEHSTARIDYTQDIYIYIIFFFFLSRTYFVERSTQSIEEQQLWLYTSLGFTSNHRLMHIYIVGILTTCIQVTRRSASVHEGYLVQHDEMYETVFGNVRYCNLARAVCLTW